MSSVLKDSGPETSQKVNGRTCVEKQAVYDYWNTGPCESATYWSRQGVHPRWPGCVPLSREYFDAVESDRYRGQPDIFGFAQFTRYHRKRVLEIGVGSGA